MITSKKDADVYAISIYTCIIIYNIIVLQQYYFLCTNKSFILSFLPLFCHGAFITGAFALSLTASAVT